MDAGSGIYERAIRGVRRLAQLAVEGADAEGVRGTLLQELGVALELERVTLVPRGGASAAGAAPASSAGGVEQVGRELVLDLSWSAAGEAVVMVARAPRPLSAGEVAVAAALVDVAGVALALIDARVDAASDELTGCLNRRAGLARLGEELARAQRTRAPVSCLMLDLDNLKQINDACGHLEGDRVLRETGARLRGQLRAYDVVARYGGDEFVAILPAADDQAARYAAARMSAAVAAITPATSAPGRLPVSVSVGAATSRPEESPESLLRRADHALLAAKRRTRSHHRSRHPPIDP